MKTAIAPNFVHSMDAAHLMLTVDASVTEGIQNFALIHDSFGTHAANTEKLARILREQFVEMYHKNDVLEEFLVSVTDGVMYFDKGIPEKPRVKLLNLDQVIESTYFFA